MISVRVRCQGRLHRISLIRGGLVLHDHPDIDAARAFIALGGDTCRCLEVLDAWRGKDPGRIPDAFREEVKRAKAVAEARGMARKRGDALAMPLKKRVQERLAVLVMTALRNTSYRRSQSRVGGGHSWQVRVGPQPHMCGRSFRVVEQGRNWAGTDSEISVVIPLHWYSRVYRRGIAVVDGAFVLDVLSEDERGIHVLAGRQGRGCNVRVATGLITPAGRLEWGRMTT